MIVTALSGQRYCLQMWLTVAAPRQKKPVLRVVRSERPQNGSAGRRFEVFGQL